MSGPENIHTHPKGGNRKFRGGGGLEGQIVNGKYEAKLEFLGGWVGQNQKPSLGEGMDIFWNHTLHFCTENILFWKNGSSVQVSYLSVD